MEDVASGISYYYCSTVPNIGTAAAISKAGLVLLHGSAFSKENWKSSGILDQFCSHVPDLSVVALDLSVSATHNSLQQVLTALEDDNVISLPIAIVTPSASGFSVVEWVQNGNMDVLSND